MNQKDILKILNRYKSTIFSGIACIGVGVTAWLTHKATIDAIDKPKDRPLTEKLKDYGFPIASGLATIGCIAASRMIDAKDLAIVTSVGTATAKRYSDYKRKNIELNGVEKHQEILRELDVEEVNGRGITAESMCAMTSLGEDTSDEVFLFHDTITDTWFKSTLARVISAEYHLNRNMNGIPESCGMANVQMWCDLLGIENKHHDERGWAVNDCFQFLDFNNSEPVDIGDGLEVIIISCVWEPVLDYENVDCWDSWPVSEELI